MRSNRNKLLLLTLATSLALFAKLYSQSEDISFRIDQPITVTNQDGQSVQLVGMQGSSVTFRFANMPDAEASIPIERNSRIRFSFPYPQNFSDIQMNVLNENYDQALRLIRNPPTDLLRFLSIPEPNCNFHLYGEIYFRALANAGDANEAVKASAGIPFGHPNLPAIFVQHAATLLNRIVNDQQVQAAEKLLNILRERLPVTEFSSIALPVADKLRLLGENAIAEGIYKALSESKDEETRKLGLLWIAYNLANTGQTEEAQKHLIQIGEITEESSLFGIYCLAHGRLALEQENTIQALRYLSRAMVRTSIADSYKPEIYFLMIQAYVLEQNMVPARGLTREMAVFYPQNMWLESIRTRFPELKELENPSLSN
ncbi:MAG: hypothetical protein ACNA77_00205 [Opitutales bacterium]